jgi:hypothetical protein
MVHEGAMYDKPPSKAYPRVWVARMSHRMSL